MRHHLRHLLRRLLRPALLLAPVIVLSACGDDPSTVSADSPGGGSAAASGDGGDTVYEANATVLEAPGAGPQLCLGGIAESLPPQCGGPGIVGWDWDAVDGEESASGTTWGTFHVVGTFLDGTFTVTEPPGPPDPALSPEPTPDFSSPCPEPPGGWAVVDPATATDAGQQEAATYATSQPDHAGLWIDQSINPALADGADPGDEPAANDPTQYILNVRFTGDLERHEAELRQRWGGALCVSPADHSEAELRAIQDELAGEDAFLYSSVDITENRVELGVIVDDGSIQQRLDAEHGTGIVLVQSALRPVN